MKLRPYQQAAFDAIHGEFGKGKFSTIATLPTGTGKTIVFAHVAKEFSPRGRVLVLAHREELIYQAANKIKAVTGEGVDIEMASQWATRPEDSPWAANFIVSSVQTQNASLDDGKRMHRFNPKDFSLLVIDEAHHAVAETYQRVVEHFRSNPDLRVLGVTATGDRGDGKGLGEVFETVAFNYDLHSAVRDGWLVPVRQFSVAVEGLDFSKCRTTAGDLNQADLAAVMEFESALHPVAHATIERAAGIEMDTLSLLKDDEKRQEKLHAIIAGQKIRKTLVFTVSVAQAERLAEIFNRWIDGCARFVCGETPKQVRRDMLEDYAKGRFSILVNVGVATEGFDDPGIELVVMARPTKSRALYAQMAGRGTRPQESIAHHLGDIEQAQDRCTAIQSSEKPFVEILDFVGNAGRHKLISTADILGEGRYEDQVIERANLLARQEAIDVERALELSQLEIDEERQVKAMREQDEYELFLAEESRKRQAEAARRAALVATTSYGITEIDAMDRHDIGPARINVGSGGSTDKQVELLAKLGVKRDTAVGFSKRQASAVIEKLKSERCTTGQAKYLRHLGYGAQEISLMNFDAASRAIESAKETAGAL